MSLSAIFILDEKGKNLIYRDYRGDIDHFGIEKFYHHVSEQDQESTITPVVQYNDLTYIFIKLNNLFFVAVAQYNSNALMILSFLTKVTKILGEYFGVVEEESVRDNFVVIYELLDEIMDYGYPQITESQVLQSYIMQASQRLEVIKPPPAVTNAVSWRSDGIKYKKNEVFVDVVEKINLLVNSQGNVMTNDVYGSVTVNAKLCGMPELRLGFNDRLLFNSTGRSTNKSVELEDVKFHQCVRLSSFEKDRTISFIPPDGKCELMSYRISSSVRPPFWVQAVINKHSGSRVEYMIKIKSQFKPRFNATNVEIKIPVPSDSFSPSFKTVTGACRYVPEDSTLTWEIKLFPGQKECILSAQVSIPSITAEDGLNIKAPINIKFDLQHYTISGLQIRYLKVVEKSGYKAIPWVRYISHHGNYEFRLS